MIIGAGFFEHIKIGNNLTIESETKFGKFNFVGELMENKLIENSIKVIDCHEKRFNRLSKKAKKYIISEIINEFNLIFKAPI